MTKANKRVKVAFFAHDYPYIGGYGNLISGEIKFLSSIYDVVFIYVFEKKGKKELIDLGNAIKQEHRIDCGFDRMQSTSDIINIIRNLSILPEIPFFTRMAWNALRYGSPLFFSPYYSQRAERELYKIIETGNIKHIFAFGVLGGLYFRNIKKPNKILDLCDSISFLYGNLSKVEDNPIIRYLMKLDGFISRRFELEMARKFETLAFINSRDGRWLGLKEGEF